MNNTVCPRRAYSLVRKEQGNRKLPTVQRDKSEVGLSSGGSWNTWGLLSQLPEKPMVPISAEEGSV